MNTINIAADATAQRIGIGNQYENEATAVVFDCSQFATDHGAGTAQVIHKRPGEAVGYICTNVTQDGNTVTWLITDDDTSFTGKGQVQLRWYVDDVLRESVIFPTYILPSVTSSSDAPEDVKSAVEKLMEYIQDNTISTEDLDERIANYFYDHPLPMEGEADGLVAGSAKQLLSESYTLDQVPYLFRKSPDSDRAVEEIVGGTVGWNQLVTAEKRNYTNSSVESNNNMNLLFRLSASPYTTFYNRQTDASNFGNFVFCAKATATGSAQILHNGQATQLKFTNNINVINGHLYLARLNFTSTDITTVGGLSVKDIQVFDLTTYFGSSTIADYIYSLETATAGAGVAKLKEWGFFTEDYYEYCEPTLKSVEGLQNKVTRDADENIIATYPLDSSLTLRGIPKLDSSNNLYYDGDIYPADGQGERRYTERAYQSGDESLADAITDGTTTVVKLSTPTTFTAQPYHNPQIVGDTEEFVTTGLVPVGHSTKYYENLRKKIEGLPWNFSSLIAPTEVSNKATRNYTAGSYLILNNTLYKVTANIANGGTITPNTNVTATTIMAEFMSL